MKHPGSDFMPTDIVSVADILNSIRKLLYMHAGSPANAYPDIVLGEEEYYRIKYWMQDCRATNGLYGTDFEMVLFGSRITMERNDG